MAAELNSKNSKNSIINKEVLRVLYKSVVLFMTNYRTTDQDIDGLSHEEYLAGLADRINMFTESAVNFGHKSFIRRQKYWLDKAKDDESIVFIFSDRKTGKVRLVKRALLDSTNTTESLTVNTKSSGMVMFYGDNSYTKLENIYLVDLMPVFLNYCRGYPDPVRDKLNKDIESLTVVNGVSGNHTVLPITYTWAANSEIVASNLYASTITNNTINTGSQKPMNKLNSVTNSLVSQSKASLETATRITAGNAANSVVKQALRPALEPAIRKMIAPKGFFGKTLGQGRVDESVDAILNSPVMDIVAATLLTTLTSSGLIKNAKVAETSVMAFDAATIKLFSLVDTDALLSGIVSKVTELSASLESLDGTQEK